ncbi:MAG: DUF5989 family protein [Myxococcota bacterium]|jgi:hypothetical protein|nr:DUF5989 family protein [Myxococcota bacterium]
MSEPKANRDESSTPEHGAEDDFLAQASEARGGVAGEFVDFLKDNKKWWLAPIILSILGLGLLVGLGGTAAAPFIYTLF